MLYKSEEVEKISVLRTAERMCVSARTAPKGRGVDNIVCAIVTGDEKEKLAVQMDSIGDDKGIEFFKRDANNIRQSEAVVLIGTEVKPRGIPNCGYCGFGDCAGNLNAGGACVFDSGDLGIAIGSAVSIAADDRVDNRIMFSAGKAAMDLNYLGNEVKIAYGIPLSTSGKSIYFDRK